MPNTFIALAVTALAILPGGLYTWAFEREVGRWSAGVTDRLLRLIGVSAVLLAALAWPAYSIWVTYLHVPQRAGNDVIYRNLVYESASLPIWLFMVPVAYVAVPIALGLTTGIAVRKRREGGSAVWRLIAVVAAGRDPAPRAWDHVFLARPAAVVRIRLRNGAGYVGGLFGEESYAAGYREAPEDLYLEDAYQVNDDGVFVEGAESGGFLSLGSGLLIAREEILHVEFFEARVDSS